MNNTLETLPGGTRLYTGGASPITTDALLLAAFCPVSARLSVCDLCAGGGIVLFSLLDRGLGGRAMAVELDETAAAQMRRSAAENGFAQLEVCCADVRGFAARPLFDLVVANPPYHAAGRQPQDARRAQARHQLACTLNDVCATAARLLKDRGRFCLCWPAGHLAGLVQALLARRLAPKRMQLVRKSPAAAPWLVLMEARKAGGEGLDILPDIILPPGQALVY